MTPDVNVLVAAFRADHPGHSLALAWLEDALEGLGHGQTFVLLPMVAAGFMRLVTNPKVFADPAPVDQALAFVRAVLDEPGVALSPLGPEWPLFEQLCSMHGLAGNDIPDAWIAAAVQAAGERLATFDRGFSRLLRPRELTLLVPPVQST